MNKLITLLSLFYFSLTLYPSLLSADQNPALAFDPVNRKYLAVYADNHDIYGRLVDKNGGTVQDVFIELSSSTQQSHPAVAFALPINRNANSNYLVVWEDGSANPDIRGKLVGSSGSVGNFIIAISSAAGSQAYPAVAYDNVNERFLVVWEDNSGTDYDIYGQLVETDGTLFGSRFLISTVIGDPSQAADKDQNSPSAAYSVQHDIDTQVKIDSALKVFLVVWEDKRNSDGTDKLDIYGQLINADGTLSGSNFLLSTDTGNQAIAADDDQTAPSVAYTDASDINSTNKQFAVVWEDRRNGDADIYGQFYDADNKILSGANFPVSDPAASGDQTAPSIAFASRNASERFITVWEDARNAATKESDIYGQYISTSGTLTGSNFSVPNPSEPATSNPEQTPSVAYSDYCNNFLSAFIRSDSITFEAEGECFIANSGSMTGPGGGGGGSVSGTGSSAGGGGCFISTAGF